MRSLDQILDEYQERLKCASKPGAGRAHQIQIVFAEFRRIVESVQEDVSQYLVERFENLVITKEWNRANLLIAAAFTRPSPSLLRPMLAILALNEEFAPNEMIVDYILEHGDSTCVPSLIETVGSRFESDPSRQLPKKCLEAILEVGGEEGIRFLARTSRGGDEELSEYAKELINSADQ